MKRNDIKSALLFAFILLWTLVIVTGYYFAHKPVTPQLIISLGKAALDFVLAGAITGLAGAVGRRLLPAKEISPLERFAVQVALGWGLFGLIWFGLGLLHLYYSWIAWVMLTLGSYFYWRDGLAWIRELLHLKEIWERTERFGRIIAVGSGALILVQLFYALAPPTKWDTLLYHLELPRRYLDANRFLFLESNPLWGRTQLTEMIYTWAVALRGLETATVLSWFFGVIFLLGVLGITIRKANNNGGWLAIAALLAGVTFRGELSWGYVDGLVALFGLGVLISLFEMKNGDKRIWFLWAGVFSGCSLGVKITAGVLFPIMFLVVIFVEKGKKYEWSIKVLSASLIAFLVFLPWLLKNYLVTGNPLYPHLWATEWMDADRLEFYRGVVTQEIGLWQYLILPLMITWFGIESGSVENTLLFFADIGPLLVLFGLPGIVSRLRSNKDASVVVTWLGIGWLTIAIGGQLTSLLQQTRMFFVLLPGLALTAAWGWQYIERQSISGARLGRVLSGLVLLIFGLTILQDAVKFIQTNPIGVVLGVNSRDHYLDRSLGWYSRVTSDLYDLPPDSQVLFLWEARGLYAPLQTDPDVLIDRWYTDRRKFGLPYMILNSWITQGYTHLLFYRVGAEFERENRPEYSYADWKALDELFFSLPSPKEYGSAYALYTLNE